MFGINGWEFVIIALVALFVFGPDKLPGAARQAGRLLRDVRRWTDRARADLTGSLGPEFENFDLADLNPRRFVQKHLLEGLDDLDGDTQPRPANGAHAAGSRQSDGVGSHGSPTNGTVSSDGSPVTGGGDAVSEPTDGGAVPGVPVDAARTRPHIDFDAT